MKDSMSKAFLAGTVLLFITLLALGCRTALRKGAEIGDDYFYRISSEVYKADDNNYLELKAQGETECAVIVLDGEEQRAELRWDENDVEITFSDDTVINGTWGNDMLLDGEGMPIVYSEEYLAISTYEEFEGVRKEVISDALCQVSKGVAGRRGSVWLMVFGSVFYVWGAAIIKYPEALFFLLSRWRYRDAELSDAGKAVERLNGAAILIVGAVFLSGIYLLV